MSVLHTLRLSYSHLVGVAILAVSAAPVRVHVYARTALARTALDHDRQLFFFFFLIRQQHHAAATAASSSSRKQHTQTDSASRKGRPETQPNNPALPY